ncbi:hypothetical protein ACP70R_008404 [Stipagrostis hirtigluma subsp. patula]
MLELLEKHLETIFAECRIDDSLEMLHVASDHYRALDLLDILLDLVCLDLEVGIPLKKVYV